MFQYDQRTSYQSIITIEPGKRGGRPCIRRMRIAVADVLGWLAAGMTHQAILADYPELTRLRDDLDTVMLRIRSYKGCRFWYSC